MPRKCSMRTCEVLGVPRLQLLTPRELPERHRFAAVGTQEPNCPISSTERGKRAELNKDTCTLRTQHTEATGFHHKRHSFLIV